MLVDTGNAGYAELLIPARSLRVSLGIVNLDLIRIGFDLLIDFGEEAHERIMTFAEEEGDARELKGFGDEACSWGDEGSNIIFRRGKYTISVATVADVERDVDAPALTREQKSARRKSEMKRLSKEFANHVAAAIDAP